MATLLLISPLIVVGFIGFLLAKYNWLSKANVDSLTKFAFNIAIPAFLFQQLANADMSNIDLNIYSAFYLPLLLIYAVAWAINYYFHKDLNHDLPASAVYAFGAGYSNNVIVGMPIAIMVLGEQVLPTIFLVVSLHSALLIGTTSLLAVNIAQFNWRTFLKHTFLNPLLIAIIGGFAINLLAIKLPVVVNNSLLLLGKPAITLALFLLGASLAFYKIRSEMKFIITASIIKLLLLPCLIFLTCYFIFQFSAITTMTLVILSASPTGVNAYLIAKQHNKHQETIAGIVVVTTVMSIVSIPLWIWALSLVLKVN